MNRDQIIAKWETLTPRERDAWVFYDVLELMPLDTTPNEFGGFGTIPRYSTDIAAAWSVMDKSAEWGGMGIGGYGKPGAQYYVAATYTDTAPYSWAVSVTRDTAPEAICLAAIIAKLTKE